MLYLDDLTVFVISSGENTHKECLAALDKQDCTFAIQQINDIAPMSAAFQAMPDRCKTPYFLQVDADMILGPTAVRSLCLAIRASPFWIYRVSAQLYEEGFGVGGAVKCWKRYIFKFTGFRDVRTVDRDLHNRMRRLGFSVRHKKEVVGIHRPRQSPFSLYQKTKSDIEKWRFLRRDAGMYALPLVELILSEEPLRPHRLLGATLGALTGAKRLSLSKNIRHEVTLYHNLLSFFGDQRLDANNQISVDKDKFFSTFSAAYMDFSGAKQLPRTALARIGLELFCDQPRICDMRIADLLRLLD